MEKINKGHYLEVTHMLHVESVNLEMHLLDHVLLHEKKMKEVRKLVEEAQKSLTKAYQMMGNKY